MEKVRKIIKKYGFVIAIVIFAIIKQLLIANIPITPYPNQAYDDNMMVDMATNIREGNWLGDYTSNTLVKGPVFPIILAIINYFGLSYINIMNIIYTISCIFFIYTLKDTFKTKKSLFAIYLILLFNPVSFAWWTMQRVYRNGITMAQVLFIIGSLFAMYKKRNGNIYKMLLYAIIGGISLATLWLTREDGIWILPFVLVVIIITLINVIIEYIKNKEKNCKVLTKKIICAILPMVILILSLHAIRMANYSKYGVYEYNEINDGYFGKVIKLIYSVKTDENIKYVTATRKKINMLYEYSETLNSIKSQLENSMDGWANNDRTPGDTQVEDGWFWWSLKEAAEKAEVYKNAQTSNEFYKKVYEEINEAIKEGKIKTQMSMPSNLMSPWKKSYFIELPKAMARIVWYVVNFEDVQTVSYAIDTPQDEEGIARYEAITNDLAVNVSKYAEKYVARLNRITKIYKILGLVCFVVAGILYIVMTIKLINAKNKEDILDTWLLFTGIICSFIVLVAGVSYNHITSCFSMYYMYLSGAYPLLIAFNIGLLCYFIENKMLKDERRNQG